MLLLLFIEVITIGKLNPQSGSATLEARRMSRNFAPFVRSRSVRGIQWPPEPETVKTQKSLEAIRYWKLTPEPADRQKKTLQELIEEEQHSPKKHSNHSSLERPKMNAKRIIPTPHRLNTPMRNPLDAYVEKIKSQTQSTVSLPKSTSVLSVGPPPAVNVSWTEMGPRSQTWAQQPQESEAIPNQSFLNIEISPSNGKHNGIINNNEEWLEKSEILEEKDILTGNQFFLRII